MLTLKSIEIQVDLSAGPPLPDQVGFQVANLFSNSTSIYKFFEQLPILSRAKQPVHSQTSQPESALMVLTLSFRFRTINIGQSTQTL